ncbi:MAG TPA: O-antigen ligase family protein [Verrucomicrobiales bacterium]|nr:O-antigen ligase family protein [Verrucomicrobiales bacterium]
MIRALDTLSFALCLLGWLLLGVYGTWKETAPFWLGAPLFWAAALLGIFSLHWGMRGRLSRSCMVSVLVFTGYIMWRALKSDVAYLARQDVVFGATAFIGWILTAVRYERPRHRFALIVVWSLLILGNLAMGLYQLNVNPASNALSFLSWLREDLSWLADYKRDYLDAEFGGFFPNSNHLCGFMELTAFILLALTVFGRVHSFVKVLCGLIFVAASVCVALSTSRGGALAFGMGIAAFAALAWLLRLLRKRQLQGKQSARLWPVVALSALALIVGSVAWHQLETKFGEGRVFNNLNGRSELWSRAFEQWEAAPILGTGARSFEYYEPSFRHMGTAWITWSETDIDAIFAHNDWLQTLADYGLIGLAFAVAVFAIHCWKGFSFLLRDSRESATSSGALFTDHRGAIVLGSLCGMIAFAIHCMADFQMHIGVNAVLAASVLGLMANPGQPDDDLETVTGEIPSSDRRIRVPAVLLAAIPAGILLWSFPLWAAGDLKFKKGLGLLSGRIEGLEQCIKAAGLMQGAVQADPLHFDAWFYWGYADTAAAQFLGVSPVFLRKSIERFKAAHELYPQNPNISASIGRTLDDLGQREEAEEWFRKALRWGDGSRLIHLYFADHLMVTGRYQEAIEHYTAVLHKQGDWKREYANKRLQRCIELLRKMREKERQEKEKQKTPPSSPPP